MANGNVRYRVYPYRWVVLLVYFVINMVIQIQWLTFAPIAREAREVYHASAMQIDLLSMIFMAVFIVVCIPASHIIDKFGIRKGVGIGALLAGIFGLLKGAFATSYAAVFACQIGLAVAQPFIMNAATKVAVHWFPINERATAVGLATLAQFVGIIIAMVVTPILMVKTGDTYNIQAVLLVYGVVSAVGAMLLLAFMREYPPTPPGNEGEEERLLTFAGIKHIVKNRDMLLLIVIFFIGLGIFNAISTCIDQLCELKGFNTEQTGLIGGMMLITGIVGAILLPPLSDKLRKRKPFLFASLILITPAIVGLTIFKSYTGMLVSSGVLGFFLLGAGAPVGFQLSAEISYPAPESLAQGVILFAGQVSGILFIICMNTLGMINSMIGFLALTVVAIICGGIMKESPRIMAQGDSSLKQ